MIELLYLKSQTNKQTDYNVYLVLVKHDSVTKFLFANLPEVLN